MQLRIVRDALRDRCERIRIVDAQHRGGERFALRRAGHRVYVDPDFRVESLARGFKHADNCVIGCLDTKLIADVETLKSFADSFRHHRFHQSRLKCSPLYDPEAGMQLERHWSNTSDLYVRALAHSFSRFVDQRDDLARREWLIALAHDTVEILEIVELLSRNRTVQLGSRALAHHDYVERLAAARQRHVDALGQGHHHQENRDG